MTDNGGEFSSDEMREIMSILNFRVITTAAESPFQNGLCERMYAVTDIMLLKRQEDNAKLIAKLFLAGQIWHVIHYKWEGLRSQQLVFGGKILNYRV